MGKELIIAEKPSVAGDIARALGGFSKQADYYESDHYVLSSAIGHLLEICVPPEQEVKRGKWTFNNLPVIPTHFELNPIEKTESRLKLLLRLIRRKDVDAIVNACDAGREGELIFRYIVQHSKTKKPVRRLWLQSMTPNAIREGFNQLRSDAALQPLADAAVCRSEADWLVGINGTRAMTAFNSKTGGFQLTTVGRVQTPTLAIVVEREEQIKKFKPRDYWELHAAFQAKAGEYSGRWFDEQFKKDKSKDADPDLRSERIWDQTTAEAIRDKCDGRPGVVEESSKPSTSYSPLLFDLTSLQREANGRFGFSASSTLKIAQALYERHKVLTYPRTDSRALPEDYLETVRTTLEILRPTAAYGKFAGMALDQDWVKPNKRIFNNAKISDHFAIIPTSQTPKKLNDNEAKLYDMVVKRFIAIFFPPAEYMLTTRITRVESEPFKTEGKVLVKAGWLQVYGKEQNDSNGGTIVPVEARETVETKEIEVAASQTRPPARFSEATLLTAMEGAGKMVEDEELRAAMSAKGLGTPATRAAIIEGLISEKYLLRNARELQPTPKAFSLITLLRGLGIPELCQAELTGDWEFKLKQMEQGRLQRSEFMKLIGDVTREIVEKAKSYESDTVPGDFGTLKNPCPKCGGEVRENYKKFQCQGCDFSVWRILAGRQFELDEMDELVSKRQIGPLQGFRSKTGRSFNAVVKLNGEYRIEFDFGESAKEDSEGGAQIDFSSKQRLGQCPVCQSGVYEDTMSYVCEKAVGKDRQCVFRVGKIILQRPIELEQVQKLIAEGKTDLLHKFISRKGRPFSAYLVLRKNGKVEFEFEPRERKTPKKKAAKKKAVQE